MELSRSELELETIVNRIRRGELDLQPDFQRGEIWDNKRRQRLIDSLLREWYVPAVHIVRSSSGGPDTVLDGQQRLAAIRDFFDDRFAVDGTTEPTSDRIRGLHGLRFSQLPASSQRALSRFALPCVTLKDYEPDEPNELFFRLNQSYNLTPPEKRNALYGTARVQVKDVVTDLQSLGLLEPSLIGFSNGRLAYDDIVSRTCLAIERADLTQHINNTVVERFYRDAEFSASTLDGIRRAGTELHELCQNVTAKLRFNKATLFTWLVFSYWCPRATGSALPYDILERFERDRRATKRGLTEDIEHQDLIGPVALYDDRASYRVTDVSSVLARDCVLYLYLSVIYGAPDILGSSALVESIRGIPETHVSQLILEFVNSSSWGMLPAHGVQA